MNICIYRFYNNEEIVYRKYHHPPLHSHYALIYIIHPFQIPCQSRRSVRTGHPYRTHSLTLLSSTIPHSQGCICHLHVSTLLSLNASSIKIVPMVYTQLNRFVFIISSRFKFPFYIHLYFFHSYYY